MKIQVQRTEITEVEVELPVYRKYGCHYYKVFSDDHCVQVCDIYGGQSIQVSFSGLAYCDEDVKDCEEKDFIEAFDRVYKLLNNHVKNSQSTKRGRR